MAGQPVAVERRRFAVRGVVQGVGFRPFVHRQAVGLGLAGRVWNDEAGVTIDVEGPAELLTELERRLRDDHPELAIVEEVSWQRLPAAGWADFTILASPERSGRAVTSLPPDVATCDACLAELRDPADRRYRYPFVNCTDCGPRFTIATRLPYDRPNTTMARFELCDDCSREYHDPGDRRFHAQPLACPRCGPQLSLVDTEGTVIARRDEALREAQQVIARGHILALKGIGGYHLVCDARQPAAVALLRERKRRPHKPLAVMVAAPEVAGAAGLSLGPLERAALERPDRPIVLVRRTAGVQPWVDAVGRGVADVGVMLPYSPLHHLLLDGLPTDVVVCTSGNVTDEPIAIDDDDALVRLRGLADAWLLHDRPIHTSCDDSVEAVAAGRSRPVRRSRGRTPLPIRLPEAVAGGQGLPPLLAMGGDLKGAVAIAAGREVWLSQHLGDLGDALSYRAAERSIEQLRALTGVTPELVVVDLHPRYLSARLGRAWAERQGVAVLAVQHHHAHLAALLAEHGRADPVIGFLFDGTGYGLDGSIWGGEVLVGTAASSLRVAHLAPVPLPGGDQAIAEPARSAVAHLHAAGVELATDLAPVRALGARRLDEIGQLLARPHLCVATSSAGRLFDAVASLLDLCHLATFEAQAAMLLEAVADPGAPGAYRFPADPAGGEIAVSPAVREMVADVRRGAAPGIVAMRFHRGLAELVVDVASAQRELRGIGTVGLSGGVFQNRLLTECCVHGLSAAGFEVLLHEAVPTNDGGLALGQALVAASAQMGQG